MPLFQHFKLNLCGVPIFYRRLPITMTYVFLYVDLSLTMINLLQIKFPELKQNYCFGKLVSSGTKPMERNMSSKEECTEGRLRQGSFVARGRRFAWLLETHVAQVHLVNPDVLKKSGIKSNRNGEISKPAGTGAR